VTYRVTYSPEAQQQLTDIFLWVANQSSSEAAERFVLSVYDFCDSLSTFPHRGIARDDLYPEMRTLGFRRRVMIAFIISEREVEIYGVYYGGRDHEGLIKNTLPDGGS
jgi:plasmid stabilization system protein ParE